MAGRHRWTSGLTASTWLLGLTVTSGLTILASWVVEEFSSPHKLLAEADFTWDVPTFYSEPPATVQRPLLFKAVDGTLLRGDFWAQAQPAPTIILCHGYRIHRSHLRSVAAVEYACGYNVLLFDFRGHGDSDSVTTSGGNAEVRDLEAAIVVASRQAETLSNRIIIHGFSMGAAVALLTPLQPEIVAIIADSPYARSDWVLSRMVTYRMHQAIHNWLPWLQPLQWVAPLLAAAIVAISTIVFRLRFGYDFVARPEATFKRWQRKMHAKNGSHLHAVPILLVHSFGDELIPIAHAHQIVAQAKGYHVELETYFVDGRTHCGAYGYDPKQYGQVMKNFLERCLRQDFPEQHRHFS